MPIWRLAHVFYVTTARPDQAWSKQSEDYSRMISPAPVPKGGGFISFSPVNRPRAFMSFIQLEGILANLRQQPCFPGFFQ